MAKAIKGCMNPECIANQKKRNFRSNNNFCPICGQELVFVCKDCRMKLADNTRRYCVRCENKHKDDREQLGKVVIEKIGEEAKAVGVLAVNAGSKAGKVAGDVAEDIKEGTEKLYEMAKDFINKKTLQIPKEYKRIKAKAPDLGFPSKDTEMYGFNNGNYSALIIKAIVPEKVSMPFNDTQVIIDDWHENMPENVGLIEVNNGLTQKGNPYVYFIMKHSVLEDGFPCGNEYTMNINVKIDDTIFFINSSFKEEGTTGVRDSAVYATYRRENPKLSNPMEGWSKDPYDPNFKKGFLMNLSEIKELDATFPEHPLSKAREFVRFVIENN